MDASETAILKAEVVALQAVMMAVFRRLAADRPELGSLFCQSFDEAETILSGVAVQMGFRADGQAALGALKVVEEIRKAVIRDEAVCSGDQVK